MEALELLQSKDLRHQGPQTCKAPETKLSVALSSFTCLEQVDVWAMGVIMYGLVSGRLADCFSFSFLIAILLHSFHLDAAICSYYCHDRASFTVWVTVPCTSAVQSLEVSKNLNPLHMFSASRKPEKAGSFRIILVVLVQSCCRIILTCGSQRNSIRKDSFADEVLHLWTPNRHNCCCNCWSTQRREFCKALTVTALSGFLDVQRLSQPLILIAAYSSFLLMMSCFNVILEAQFPRSGKRFTSVENPKFSLQPACQHC